RDSRNGIRGPLRIRDDPRSRNELLGRTHDMSPTDHFSGHAAEYFGYRLTHPDLLFERRVAVVLSRRLGWNCGAGTVSSV
ncbi:MAG: hypothetical protein O6950_08585, partial [Gammaproteobacteria bacterium]|nr:hypothetical protein [Gammaproteobacteria bacterium]